MTMAPPIPTATVSAQDWQTLCSCYCGIMAVNIGPINLQVGIINEVNTILPILDPLANVIGIDQPVTLTSLTPSVTLST